MEGLPTRRWIARPMSTRLPMSRPMLPPWTALDPTPQVKPASMRDHPTRRSRPMRRASCAPAVPRSLTIACSAPARTLAARRRTPASTTATTTNARARRSSASRAMVLTNQSRLRASRREPHLAPPSSHAAPVREVIRTSAPVATKPASGISACRAASPRPMESTARAEAHAVPVMAPTSSVVRRSKAQRGSDADDGRLDGTQESRARTPSSTCGSLPLAWLRTSNRRLKKGMFLRESTAWSASSELAAWGSSSRQRTSSWIRRSR